jgi:hypothetical protein
MRVLIIFGILLASAIYPLANEQGVAWHREEKSDPLHKLSYTQFALEGKYLVSPKHPDPTPPLLVARCKTGGHRYSRKGELVGTFLTGYLVVDAVLDFRQGSVPVEFRLDDGKLQRTTWSSSTDGSGAFFSTADFDNLLYGHLLPHKPNTNPPVRKVILGVPEYLGAEIEVEFEMPEPGEVADLCGAAIHER